MGSQRELAAVQAQFSAQVAALGALSQGSLPPESILLAACGGKIPMKAASELAAAAAALRGQRICAAPLPPEPTDKHTTRERQQQVAADPSAGPQAGEGSQDVPEPSEAGQLQAAIRDKLRRLAPQKRKVQEEVLLERSLRAQCTEYHLMDWRRMRRPLPGSNPKAFEPPLQPTALLMQQAAIRAQRAAVAARADKLRQHRTYLEQQQREQQQQQQQQEALQQLAGQEEQAGPQREDGAPSAATPGAAAGSDGVMAQQGQGQTAATHLQHCSSDAPHLQQQGQQPTHELAAQPHLAAAVGQ